MPPSPPPAPAELARLRMANPALEEMDHVAQSRERGVELARKQGRPNFTVGLEYGDMKQPEGMPAEWPYMFGVEAARGILGRDPAMGASVMITAMTDSGGFFIFLGLATLFLL